jgi:hypothetical protein
VSRAALAVCVAWIALALAVAALGAARGAKKGALPLVAARLKSPTLYLFSAYLLLAALVTPMAPGESTSPLLWLGLALPVAYAMATLAAVGPSRQTIAGAALLALLYGGSVLAGAALILSLASPAFVPAWLR